MPRYKKKSSITKNSRSKIIMKSRREARTSEECLQDNERNREYIAKRRLEESQEKRNKRLQAATLQSRQMRQNVTDANRQENRERMQIQRALKKSSFIRMAFGYDPKIDYSSHSKIMIGKMDKECGYCHALLFKNEAPGMCCASGKVVLPSLKPPPEPLKTLISGITHKSKLFLKKIRQFNCCFQMSSFGATNIVQNTNNVETTFKIQGQVYHRIGSLLPMPDENHKYLQIYFISNEEDRVNARCSYNYVEKLDEKEIVASLEKFLNDNNNLIKLFKIVSNRLQNDDYMVIIKADKVPVGEHARRFNAPTVNEVAIVMVGEHFESRDIKIMRRDNTLQMIKDTHRSYDAFQYPLIFWEGEDGYQINIKQRNPSTGEETSKNVSAMKYYSYRLMIRSNEDNHILKCRQLFHQYVVDMFAKIESERLRYIRFNQAKLRAEEYIHLRDAVNNNLDKNLNISNIGNVCILPSSYTGSPRHMQEYIQDAMAFVRAFGRPDLFITFTCNPQWDEITNLLLPGQSSIHRHDITARVFKQKLKSLIDLIVKHHVFGEIRCWMYSIEWQKRGLPHAHILIWCIEKIRPEEIDKIISAEIPDPNIDKELFEIVKKNMIHGPCGHLNMTSPCMENGKCTKQYPKDFLINTITGIDGYPLYRRRNPENGGQRFLLKLRNNENEIDNRWVVPYSPLLTKTYKAHINVELCSSVKSIKYICKYVHKGSDMAVFSINNVNENDEITRYQMGRYISSNEAIWRIFGFPIHERDPTVTHLSVHLENGQRVYFNEQNAIERALTAPKTTLTEFFELIKTQNIFGQFARTLLYSEVSIYFIWNKTSKKWEPRKRGVPVRGYPGLFSTNTLSRLYTVHIKQRECFFLRLLLINVRGPTSYEYLRTVNGQLYDTYHDACRELQLLEGDNHWDISIADAVLSSSPYQIRHLFAIILTTCFPNNPSELWEKFKDAMSEDILYRHRTTNQDLNMQFTNEIYNESLIMIEDICLLISNDLLKNLGLSSPNRLGTDLLNIDMQREIHYNTENLDEFITRNEQMLTHQQKQIYVRVLKAISEKEGGFFFWMHLVELEKPS